MASTPVPTTTAATSSSSSNSSKKKKKTLIVCDFQPDVVQKLHPPYVDLVRTAIQAARKSPTTTGIVYTLLQLQEGYAQVPPSHPRLGVLRKLSGKVNWFTSNRLSLEQADDERVVTRSTFLPHATDAALIETLREASLSCSITVLGYRPTVQAICHLLGDLLACPNVQLVQECIADESGANHNHWLKHGLLFREHVITLVDYLESLDLLHERIIDNVSLEENSTSPVVVKYVCDCGRGGHLSLFLPYLLRDYGYTEWPTQPWYQEQAKSWMNDRKQYYCPLGRRIIDLCDEPQFGQGTRFFLKGRHHLDEKDLLYQLVPELMPPTFATLKEAQDYASCNQKNDEGVVWFLKKVNQNGGRAVHVTLSLPPLLEADDQLQAHVPRPLLYDNQFKCHVKTYQYIACNSDGEWDLYMHDLFYLAVASRPWSTTEVSDDVQITTMRTHRLYPDDPWRLEWNLSQLCYAHMTTVLQRAILQNKLQSVAETRQFEINSADWMLDQDGRMYLIECNGIPVLYDPGIDNQPLLTKGLQLYDRLYRENPATAVVNDHDLLSQALELAMTGTLPKKSLWKHLTTLPSPTSS